MRMKAAILATLMLVSAACSAAAPAPQQSTEADITLSGAPVGITLWHALSGPQQVALDAMVKKFNETNGKGITVSALNQGNYTQLYQKTLGAIQAGALPELAHAYESFRPRCLQGQCEERPREGEPGRHLQGLLRHQHLPAVREQAAVVAVHQIARCHVCEQRRTEGDRQADPQDLG